MGTLQTVDLRSVWSGEAAEFTPWLAEAESLALLAQPLGLELEITALEKRVGPVRADLLCKDHASGRSVVIEAQLTRSDHGHLGQLLTHAAGLDVAAVIWLAPSFCDEHVAALKWLNKISEGRTDFFAVTMELLSISGSVPAPRFNIAATPKGWSPKVKIPREKVERAQTQSAQRRIEYWQEFLRGLHLEDGRVQIPKPNRLGNLWFNLKGHELWITVYAAASVNRMGVFLRGKPEYYAKLRKDRRAIEANLGETVRWDDGDQWNLGIRADADPTDRADWARQHKWLAQRLKKFIRVFQPYRDVLT